MNFLLSIPSVLTGNLPEGKFLASLGSSDIRAWGSVPEMIRTKPFLLAAGGLFDFDLTFLAEGLLFVLLSFVVTFVFLIPISSQIQIRAELINFNLRKASLLVTYGYNQLSTCVELLTEELVELNRQIKLTRTYTNAHFEKEINSIQQANIHLLSKLKGELAIQSAFLIQKINPDLSTLTKTFFDKKFNPTGIFPTSSGSFQEAEGATFGVRKKKEPLIILTANNKFLEKLATIFKEEEERPTMLVKINREFLKRFTSILKRKKPKNYGKSAN